MPALLAHLESTRPSKEARTAQLTGSGEAGESATDDEVELGEEAEDEQADEDNVIDRDIELIMKYVRGRLREPERHDVRTRLEEDADFRAHVGPLIVIWCAPRRWERKPIPKEVIAEQWRRIGERAKRADRWRAVRRRILYVYAPILIVGALLVFALYRKR